MCYISMDSSRQALQTYGKLFFSNFGIIFRINYNFIIIVAKISPYPSRVLHFHMIIYGVHLYNVNNTKIIDLINFDAETRYNS